MKKENIPFATSAVVLFFATIYFVLSKNFEFIAYAAILFIFIYALYKSDSYVNYLPIAKWGFLSWMILHMAGGALYPGGTRLYDIIIIPITDAPLYILKFDQFVHWYCYVVITLLMYSVLLKISKPKPNKFLFYLVLWKLFFMTL